MRVIEELEEINKTSMTGGTLKERLSKLPEEDRSRLREYEEKVQSCESNINKLSKLFVDGHTTYGDKFLDLGSLPDCIQAVTAVYSYTTQLWGKIRGEAEGRVSTRRFIENVSHWKIKSYANEKAKQDLRLTQKDVESIAASRNENYYILEREWGLLYSRISACKDVLETHLKSLDLLWKTGRTEWSATR